MEKVKVTCKYCNKEFPLEEGFHSQLEALQSQAREKGKTESEADNKKLREEFQKLKEKNEEKAEQLKNAKTLRDSAVQNAVEDQKLKNQTVVQEKDLKLKRAEESNKSLLAMVEKQKKIIDQGGSADQGSAQEIVLLDFLKNKVFQFRKEDKFSSYGKGKKGGDVLHEVVEKGMPVGRILYESKNTGNFDRKWTSKILEDMSDSKADVCIIFTRAVPSYFIKDEDYHQDNNVFICKYDHTALRTLARLNRLSLIDAKNVEKNPKSNQTSVVEFYSNPDNKNKMFILSKSQKSAVENVKKIKIYADKAAQDLDKSDKELEELYKNLSKVGVHFKK